MCRPAVPCALLAAAAIVGTLAATETISAPLERPAVEARLIGLCNGRVMAAVEESAFPAGCTWIEPIRYQGGAL